MNEHKPLHRLDLCSAGRAPLDLNPCLASTYDYYENPPIICGVDP